MAFTPGFIVKEARELLAMLAPLERTPPPPLQQPPFPSNWTIIFDSQQIEPLDYRWQLASNAEVSGQYAILIGGTFDEPGSIIEDMLSAMIPAIWTVSLGDISFSYQFAEPADAPSEIQPAIHPGFTFAALILMYSPSSGILRQLLTQVPPESDIFIAGHGRGAAIATLCRSFLNYPSNYSRLSSPLNFNYKSYFFAQPKPGNDLYRDDFNRLSAKTGMAFSVSNDQDWVPQVPLTFEFLRDLKMPNPLHVDLTNERVLAKVSDAISQVKEGIEEVQTSKHERNLQLLGQIMERQSFQNVDLAIAAMSRPPFLPTLNFVGCGSPYTLRGDSDIRPDNPDDHMWQHHAALYYLLLAGASGEGS